jgi:formylglycine-generating enzyme required for sulfatase activity
MTGNTWDWTSSLYTPYPYDAADGREAPSPPGARRVVRGGSWGPDQVLARVSCRYAFAPGDRGSGLGLRVVRSSHILL